jgi:hypothetical protein
MSIWGITWSVFGGMVRLRKIREFDVFYVNAL